jgi:hypothetical protein
MWAVQAERRLAARAAAAADRSKRRQHIAATSNSSNRNWIAHAAMLIAGIHSRDNDSQPRQSQQQQQQQLYSQQHSQQSLHHSSTAAHDATAAAAAAAAAARAGRGLLEEELSAGNFNKSEFSCLFLFRCMYVCVQVLLSRAVSHCYSCKEYVTECTVVLVEVLPLGACTESDSAL